MVEKFMNKPVVCQAIKFDGTNREEIIKWSEGRIHFVMVEDSKWVMKK